MMWGPGNESIAYYLRGNIMQFIPVTWDMALDSCMTHEEIDEMVRLNPSMFATKDEVAAADSARLEKLKDPLVVMRGPREYS